MTGLRAKRLEKLSMVWSLADERFQGNLEAAKAYYEEHWTLRAPRCATMLDRSVGQWLSYLRRPGALAECPEWETALKAVDEDFVRARGGIVTSLEWPRIRGSTG
ncbi:helicase associated domain-containing protein [Streptomyces sp. NPDC056930]|uniref:helicase associated domain-containing protein n=1 Tax=Streptomyces sp. NPDC056930 TaxID=3345967 RepID=UPI003640B010